MLVLLIDNDFKRDRKMKAKWLLILLSAILVNSNVMAYESCSQYEAQFIGTANKIESQIEDGCLVKVLSVDIFNVNILCPLLLEDVFYSEIKLTESQCENLSSSKKVSGVLYFNDDSEYIRLEE